MLTCPSCRGSLDPARLDCPACGVDASLWLARAGEVFGPYTGADLQRAQAEGRLGAEDQVKVGEGDWGPLAELLVAATPVASSLPPPPPPVVYASPQPASKSDSRTVVIILAVVAFLGLPILAILAAIIFPVFAKAREKARQTSCMSNMKQLSLAMLQYTQDYDERFPPYVAGSDPVRTERVGVSDRVDVTAEFPVGDWRRNLYPYMKNAQVFVCPTKLDKYSYQFNDTLSRLTLSKVKLPAETLCLYESGFLTGSPVPPHNHGWNVGFTDGHVKWMLNREGVRTAP